MFFDIAFWLLFTNICVFYWLTAGKPTFQRLVTLAVAMGLGSSIRYLINGDMFAAQRFFLGTYSSFIVAYHIANFLKTSYKPVKQKNKLKIDAFYEINGELHPIVDEQNQQQLSL